MRADLPGVLEYLVQFSNSDDDEGSRMAFRGMNLGSTIGTIIILSITWSKAYVTWCHW